MEPCETAAMQVSARTISAKTSIEPKRTATRASCGAARIRSAQERSPPSTEAAVAQPSASPPAAVARHRPAVERRGGGLRRAGRVDEDGRD